MSDDSQCRDALDVLAERDRFYEAVQALARIHLDSNDSIRQYVEDWPDDDLARLVEHVSGPEVHRTCGGRVVFYDEVAKVLRGVLGSRKMVRRANELNVQAYCPICDGECDWGEQHEANSKKRGFNMTETEARLQELSRQQLIQLLLTCEGSWTL